MRDRFGFYHLRTNTILTKQFKPFDMTMLQGKGNIYNFVVFMLFECCVSKYYVKLPIAIIFCSKSTLLLNMKYVGYLYGFCRNERSLCNSLEIL